MKHLRDEFAAAAMQGLLSGLMSKVEIVVLADTAYRIAEEMLVEKDRVIEMIGDASVADGIGYSFDHPGVAYKYEEGTESDDAAEDHLQSDARAG